MWTRPAEGRKSTREPSSATRAVSAHSRASTACPVSATASWRSGSGCPAAIRSCHSTRSSPVTSSVTGCSTWSRVFISMKQYAPGSAPGTMNSTVPAPR